MGKVIDLEDLGTEACAALLAKELASGGLAIFPTDTVYGLAASVEHPHALRRIFELKGRGWEKSLVIMPPSLRVAESWVAEEALPRLRRLARFWPGSLTVVVRRRGGLPWMEEVAPGRETLGLRIPDHPLALAVLRAAGPLAVTSANLSGQDPPRTFEEIPDALLAGVGMACRSSLPGSGTPSTIIELRDKEVSLIRSGALDLEVIMQALEREEGAGS